MVLQGTSQGDLTGALAILAVAADQKATTERLKQLTEAAKDAEAKIASASAALKVVNAVHDEATKLHNDATEMRSALITRAALLDEREAELTLAERTLADTQRTQGQFLTKRQNDLDLKEAALLEHGKTLTLAQVKLDELVQKTTKLKDEYETRLEKIKAAAA